MPVAFLSGFGIAGRLFQGLAQKLERFGGYESACGFCMYNMDMQQLSWKQSDCCLRFWRAQSFTYLDYLLDFLITYPRQKDRITV